MKIFIASDHGGYNLKGELKSTVLKEYDVVDLGTNNENSVDYPDYSKILCEKIISEENSLGILICGTGQGMSMSANKYKEIRAALCTNELMARLAKQHNNANVLCLGARIVGDELAKSIVNEFLASKFEGDRHQKRIDKFSC